MLLLSLTADRYVLLGNHRDAWGYGASDPSSGTAQMLETARVLGELMKTGNTTIDFNNLLYSRLFTLKY